MRIWDLRHHIEKKCPAVAICSLSQKDTGIAAEEHGQLTGQEITEIASLKAKLLSAFSKIKMLQKIYELKHPMAAHDGKIILQISQEKHSGYHRKPHKNASCVQH